MSAAETSGAQPTLLYLEGGQSAQRPSGTIARRAPAGRLAGRQLVIDLETLTDPEALRRVGGGVLAWLIAVLVGGVVVAYLVGPLFALHTQRALTQQLQLAVTQAYGAAHDSLEGATPVVRSSPIGSAVAVLQIPALQLQQTVAEGAGAGVLRGGAGHVPGTAGPGQPGNSMVVARRHAFGGPFNHLDLLEPNDKIIVMTVQGKSLYSVVSVNRVAMNINSYNPAATDELTLLTSPSRWPLSAGRGLVVTAKLVGKPYVPTPQNGFSSAQDGRHGDAQAWPLLILELLALVATVVVAMTLYRRWSAPATYLITTPALLALVIFLTLTGTRLLPGWF